MKRVLPLIVTFLYALILPPLHAQERGAWARYVDRLEAFGQKIPQEKVYIHMDNTCYFLGDIIWFKAYLRQTNTDSPSRMSGTLYVELFGEDGYLVERKIVEMRDGEGDGYFYLPDDSTIFAGFYELRAYTRWQLNWGQHDHGGVSLSGGWFFNKATRHEYYRDYDKLYSRVFPVYNKPLREGEYEREMTRRPLQRTYKEEKKGKAEPTLTLYPEGGNLVAGVPCRVAFEAVRADGEWLEGTVNGARTVNRGRGVLEITPEKGERRELVFVTDDGERVKAKLPKPETDGVALSVAEEGEKWVIRTHVAGRLERDSLALTVMHEGKLQAFHPLDGTDFCLQKADLPAGVQQVTVFDTQGRVWADRLFFVTHPGMAEANVHIAGGKSTYAPYEQIILDVQTGPPGSTLSLAVRDASVGSRTYDTAGILAEMLLSSEIRGFVPDAGWFFEQDDKEHRSALDMLMMTQGWRRFQWKDMAVKGEWEFVHPMEKTPILTGAVHTYQSVEKFDPKDLDFTDILYMAKSNRDSIDFASKVMLDAIKEFIRGTGGFVWMPNGKIYDRYGDVVARAPYDLFEAICIRYNLTDRFGRRMYKNKDLKKNARADSLEVTDEMRERMTADGEKLKREVRVHSEMIQTGSENAVVADAETHNGQFQLTLPRFYDYCTLFLTASDTTRWNKKEKP